MEKPLNIFTDMYRLCAIVAPLNVSTKKLAEFLSHRFERCEMTDVVSKDINTEVLILYETDRTDFSLLHHSVLMKLKNPPNKIVVVLGFGTKTDKFLELVKYPISLVYALFCEVKTSLTIQLNPISFMADNLALMGANSCENDSCKGKDRSFVDNGQYNDLTAGVLHFSNGLTSKVLRKILITGGNKRVFGYFDDYNEASFRKVKTDFDESMEIYLRLKSTCNSYLIMEGDNLVVSK